MISDSALSPADLPTVILFTEGKEVRRLPELVLKSDEDKVTGFGVEVSQEKVKDSGKDIIKRLAWDRSKVSEKRLRGYMRSDWVVECNGAFFFFFLDGEWSNIDRLVFKIIFERFELMPFPYLTPQASVVNTFNLGDLWLQTKRD